MSYKKCTLHFKATFLRKLKKNWLFSNHCLCRLVPCISMKLATFVECTLLAVASKSARICLNISRNSVIQSLRSRKHEVASFPCRDWKNWRICSWYSLPELTHNQMRFIRIPSLREMRHLVTF